MDSLVRTVGIGWALVGIGWALVRNWCPQVGQEDGDSRPEMTDFPARNTTEDGDSAGIPKTKTRGFRGIPGDSRGFQQEDNIPRVPCARTFLGFHEEEDPNFPSELETIIILKSISRLFAGMRTGVLDFYPSPSLQFSELKILEF